MFGEKGCCGLERKTEQMVRMFEQDVVRAEQDIVRARDVVDG